MIYRKVDFLTKRDFPKEVLPMLLSPSPVVPLHVQNALTSIHPPSPELPAQAQLRALVYAVRWEMGIASSDFSNNVLEGERWLVWAAGNVRFYTLGLDPYIYAY